MVFAQIFQISFKEKFKSSMQTSSILQEAPCNYFLCIRIIEPGRVNLHLYDYNLMKNFLKTWDIVWPQYTWDNLLMPLKLPPFLSIS